MKHITDNKKQMEYNLSNASKPYDRDVADIVIDNYEKKIWHERIIKKKFI